MSETPYARLPQLDRLLHTPYGRLLLSRYPRSRVVESLRTVLDDAREAIRAGIFHFPEDEDYLKAAEERLKCRFRPSLRRVINATGVVLHTNLGRSVLAPSVVEAVVEAASNHTNLEMDLESGLRGSRQSHVSGLLCRLTGAEAAMAVNNNAAAVFLALTALAAGREVIVSRGQLVEIGGSFRISDIIRSGGAKLVEVGTTNRTRLDDYRRAVTAETAMILKVHPSNYRVVGFTEEVESENLVALGREYNLPVMEDLGSGALVDLAAKGIGDEPTAGASLAAGLDLVTISGDKMLGGPQAGILLGRRDCIDVIKSHPLARALRCDKMTLAALEATLRLYEEERAWEEVPTLRYLSRTPEEVRGLAERLRMAVKPPLRCEIVPGLSQVGGGSLPGEEIPTSLLSLWSEARTDAELSSALRGCDPPVVGRTQGGRVLLDLRTVEEGDLPLLADALDALRENLL